ncbi:hypothetical protein PI124_g5472 [Phytophthora idaei]|nr:hypothetical protein PI125_g9441 [Phytophthora idaei]KAG3156432.1 hypothetical protein PI126_g8762 [Phytophthora idaei]KAG3249882.1 hypothetical protein PI124_g5472 [Phytophthora idaei]
MFAVDEQRCAKALIHETRESGVGGAVQDASLDNDKSKSKSGRTIGEVECVVEQVLRDVSSDESDYLPSSDDLEEDHPHISPQFRAGAGAERLVRIPKLPVLPPEGANEENEETSTLASFSDASA